MSACRFVVLPVLLSMLGLASCGRASAPAPVTPEPAPAPAPATDDDGADAGGPEVTKNTYVSTSHNEESGEATTMAAVRGDAPTDDAAASGFVVTTPDGAKEVARAAVRDQLDEKMVWKLSPVLPSSWPTTEGTVAVYFYPMSANPGSLTEHQLYSPAFRVDVTLLDGSTAITPMGKRRKLGTIEETRPSSLERRELDLAEAALVRGLVGLEVDQAQRPYWGYLKYAHEHDEIGRDLQKRAPAFFSWLRQKHGK